ncbi:MAG: hypothetical protein H7Y20_02655 [Bryobacteraceae bacterium]|nr:hypothetical protein [Bryobacteraceae bacterium]
MSLVTTVICTLAFATVLAAQTSTKSWAGPDEYDLGSQAFAEVGPTRQLELLRTWVARYPKTDFERERLIALSLVFRQTGQVDESLNRAAQALTLNANDPAVLFLIARLGPMLQSASEDQRSLVENAAVKLLSTRITKPVTVSSGQSPSTAESDFIDAEAHRVSAFIRQLRTQAPAPKDPEIMKREVAEAALQWARSAKH